MEPAGDQHLLPDMGGQLGGQDALHGVDLLWCSQRDPREAWARGILAVPPHLRHRPEPAASCVRPITGANRWGLLSPDSGPFFPRLRRVFTPRRQAAITAPGGSLGWRIGALLG